MAEKMMSRAVGADPSICDNAGQWDNEGGMLMPERYTNAVYVLFALAAISGGLGGCTIAGHRLLTGQKMRVSFFVAYGIVGAAFGVLFAAYGWVLTDAHPVDVIGPSLLAGMAGSAALGSMNWTARFILKHLGIEIQVTMRKSEEERRKEENQTGSERR